MSILKDIIVWKYERASWQWDILCLVIMAFIFLTPKAWFDKRENLATQTARLIVKADDFSADRAILEKRVRDLSGSQNAEILNWQQMTDPNGQTFYQVDIK